MHEQHYKYVSEISAKDLRDIMDRYGEDVWKYAFFLTKKTDLADDIAQEVFIKAYQSIHSFRGESTLKTWLLKITRNTSFSFRKKAYFKYHILTRFAQANGVHPSAEETALEREFAHEIWGQVMHLSDKYREAILLNAHYQFSLEEIADMLQISVNTVKSRLFRARKELHKLMKGGLSS